MDSGSIRIPEKNLVLKVDSNVDINVWDETKYHELIDTLVGNRDYQKNAIFTALRFMCIGQYDNIKQLAFVNYNKNDDLRNLYTSFEVFQNSLPFPNSYTASIDLATGTGKSWVMYGIALIMLAEKIVDQVLVLVPSVTIEEELTKKFKFFSLDSKLNQLIKTPPPRIINSTESIVKGCICIENRDAVYEKSTNSIIDSLSGKGEKTLLLCDEVHHVYYTDENEWKKFVEKIGFKYNIGLSGTCYYKDNTYLSNVIYRYSLKEAIEDRRVKNVEYVDESNMPVKNEDKWKVIDNSHEQIKKELKILPLTLVVTATTPSCEKIANDFKKYLSSKYGYSEEELSEKVIVVHSKNSAKIGRLKLKDIDSSNSKVEWIFSVSMLTEGWDVKRVFQIVPHEERAFNSKLLISQVMGRGLRIPDKWDYQNDKPPKVIIFNHEKWSVNVKRLVNEVLEYERKITNSIINNSKYNFDILNVTYKSDKNVVKTKMEGTYKLFEKGFISLPTDCENETINTNFVEIQNNNERQWTTIITHKTFTVTEMAKIMWYRFEDIPDDNNENLCEKYQKEWTVEKLEKIIKKSLEKSGNTEITEKLKQKFLSAMGVVFRQGSAAVEYNSIPDQFEIINTSNLGRSKVSASALKKEKVLFWTDNTERYLSIDESEFFKEIIDTTNQFRQKKIENLFNFKTPQSFVVADSEPEKEFIKKLTEQGNNISSWIKSNQIGFYSIEYSWRKGEHPQRGSFNPDFFIKTQNRIIVVEIKSDEQINNPDLENIGKYKSAIEHFEYINKKLNGEKSTLKYKFTMLTPCNFEVFFNKIDSGNESEIDKFKSELDASIDEQIRR